MTEPKRHRGDVCEHLTKQGLCHTPKGEYLPPSNCSLGPCVLPVEGEPPTDSRLRELNNECFRALKCLHLEVDSSIANDVGAKVRAYVVELQRQLDVSRAVNYITALKEKQEPAEQKELPWVEYDIRISRIGALEVNIPTMGWCTLESYKRQPCGYRFEDGSFYADNDHRVWVLRNKDGNEYIEKFFIPNDDVYSIRIEWANRVCFSK